MFLFMMAVRVRPFKEEAKRDDDFYKHFYSSSIENYWHLFRNFMSTLDDPEDFKDLLTSML